MKGKGTPGDRRRAQRLELRGLLVLGCAALLCPGPLAADVSRVGDELILSEGGAVFPTGPSAAFARDGTFLTAWTEQGSDGNGFVHRARRFDSQGSPLDDSFQINETALGKGHNHPRVVRGPQEVTAVAWTQEAGDDGRVHLRIRLLGADASFRGEEISVPARLADEDLFGDPGSSWMTFTRDGQLVIVWDSFWFFNLIEGQRFSLQGRPLGRRFVVSHSNGFVGQASVAATANGGFAVAWGQRSPFVTNEGGALVRPFDSQARPLALEVPVTVDRKVRIGVGSPAVVGRPDGGFAVVVSRMQINQNRGVHFRLFDENGAPLGDEVRLDDGGSQRLIGSPRVAGGDDGTLVVVWDQLNLGNPSTSQDIVARVIEPDGSFAGPPFVVNSTTRSVQAGASVSVGPDGEVLVVWVDNPEQGDWSIRGQLYQIGR